MVTQKKDGNVEFRFFRPNAQRVSLCGDFNGWQDSYIFNRKMDGWWECRLKLAPGVYQFKYKVDGEWYIDYAAFGLDEGPHGWSSVLQVTEPSGSKSEVFQAA